MSLEAPSRARPAAPSSRCGASAAATSTTPGAAELADGRAVFVKTRAGAAPGEYAAEAAGAALARRAGRARACRRCSARPTTLPRARVGRRGRRAATRPRRSAAGSPRCTRAGAPSASAAPTARCGSAPLELPNEPAGGLARVLRRAAARAAAARARDRGALSRRGAAAVERVCERIADLAGPPEPPARLHGDLWSGNVLAGADGRAVADRPGRLRRPPRGRPRDAAAVRRARAARFFAAYEEAAPLADGPRGPRRRSTSCSRCSSTRCCSAAATAASAERAARRYAG